MAVAGGAPLGWLAAVATVLRQVIKLEEAQATMTDTSLDVQGTARKQKDAEEARAGLKTGLTSAFKLQHKIKYLEPTIPTVSPVCDQSGKRWKAPEHYGLHTRQEAV